MKTITLSLCLLLMCITTRAQTVKLDWARQMAGPMAQDINDMAVDAAGNTIAIGSFQDTVHFGTGSASLPLTTAGAQDIFLFKRDAAGNLLWAEGFGGPGIDEGFSVTLDESGNIYAFGNFAGKVDFDPGPDTAYLTASGYTGTFLCKYDAGGHMIRAQQILARGVTGANVRYDHFGHLYVCGGFAGSFDFDHGPAVTTLSTLPLSGNIDAYVMKLDTMGNFLWVRQMGGKENDYALALSIDTAGSILTTGRFIDSTDFDPGPGTAILVPKLRNVDYDMFISKLDSSGNFLWAKNIHARTDCITTDRNGNVFTAGFFSGREDFDPGPDSTILTAKEYYCIYVSKLDAAGNFAWARQFDGNPTTGIATFNVANAIVTDLSGNVYTTGQFYDTLDFDPGPDTFLIAPAAYSMFVSKLDTAGKFVWVKDIAGKSAEGAIGVHIGLSSDNAVYTAGQLLGDADADPGPDSMLLSPSPYLFGCFIHKMSQCMITYDTLEYNSCGDFELNDSIYTKSGIFRQTLVNMHGCDSILILKLTIDRINDSVDVAGARLSAKEKGATYQWLRCPSYVMIPGATDSSYTATTDGDYALVLTKGTCTDTSDCYTISGTGIKNNSLDPNGFVVQPNPATEQITILSSDMLHNVCIQLTDVTGRIVLQVNAASGNRFFIDLSGQRSGLYFIKVLNSDRLFPVEKILKY